MCDGEKVEDMNCMLPANYFREYSGLRINGIKFLLTFNTLRGMKDNSGFKQFSWWFRHCSTQLLARARVFGDPGNEFKGRPRTS